MSNNFGPMLDVARTRQAYNNPLFDDRNIRVSVKEPTAFVFTGDWHLGAPGTNYALFEEDTYELASMRATLKGRLYIVGMGDYIDGYLPNGTPRNPYQVLEPMEQRKVTETALDYIQPNVVIAGDHDLWHSKQSIQLNWLFEYTQQRNIKYAQWGTELLIQAGETEQKWLVRHRYSGSRAAHPTGPHKKMVNELGPATVGVLGHTHSYPGIHRAYTVRRNESSFYAVQTGTYKEFDEYGKKLADYKGEYGVPAIVVNPDGLLVPFDRYQDAVSFIK